ncbi:MAG: hypothetical protein DCF24_12945 [Cyanobium sp.]|nr:MAG: hypothetical protein DCF24_12945 [Cyanobium sp.]
MVTGALSDQAAAQQARRRSLEHRNHPDPLQSPHLQAELAVIIGSHGVKAAGLLHRLESDTLNGFALGEVRQLQLLTAAATEVEHFLRLELAASPPEHLHFRQQWRSRLHELARSLAVAFNRRQPQLWRITQAVCTHLFLDQFAGGDRDIYRDAHLWALVVGEGQRREGWVVVRNHLQLWTTQPSGFLGKPNIRPPLSSFRNARRALSAWQGGPICGDLTGTVAERLCRSLGIRITPDKRVVIGCR